MALLAMLQGVADLVNVVRPSAIITSTDPAVRRMLAYANVEGRELAKRHDWTVLTKEATFTTVATASQGTLVSIATDLIPEQGARIINDTMWNQTTKIPVLGPLSSVRYQRLTATVATGPYPEYRFRQGSLYFKPTPTAGHTVGFEYITPYWCQSAAAAGQNAWAADTDTGVLSEHLMQLGVLWRWKKANELNWEEDNQIYEQAVLLAIARDGTRGNLDMTGDSDWERRPGVFVPEGSWSL